MTQSQINYFLAVAGDGSITRAASRLFVSQPAISKSISAMEKELGFALFSRWEKSITLTYAGKLLYEFFSRSKDEYRHLLKEIDQYRDRTSRHIRIGCPSTWNPEAFCPAIMDHFRATQPDLTIGIECFPLPEMLNMLKNRELDMILSLDLRETFLMGMCTKHIATIGCGVLYSKKCFPNVKSIGDLRYTQFLGWDTSAKDQFEAMAGRLCGDEFTPAFKNCANYHTAVFELTRGNGVMIFADWDSAVHSELFEYLPLDTNVYINAVFSVENQAAAAFADELAQIFGCDGQK